MPKTLSASDPTLRASVGRLQRTQRVWGILLLALGVLTFGQHYQNHPIAGLPFIIIGLLCLVWGDPFLLAPVGLLMAFSIVPTISPNLPLFGPDPLRQMFQLSGIELVGLIIGKILIVVTAFNHFSFYRFLYGTARASLDDPSLPVIPELVPNRTNRYARWAQWLGGLGLAGSALALVLAFVERTAYTPYILAELGGSLGGLALGVGFGVAFSPTDERPTALRGALMGLLAYVVASGVLWWLG